MYQGIKSDDRVTYSDYATNSVWDRQEVLLWFGHCEERKSCALLELTGGQLKWGCAVSLINGDPNSEWALSIDDR